MEIKGRVYYSQNREDLILESFFPEVKRGFYVDVGANDPVVDSVTKLFYDKGWKGINIEPISSHYQALLRQRPRDINLNIGIGSSNSYLTFYEYTSGNGLSTFSTEMVNEYTKLNDEIHKDTQEYEVEVKLLKDVFKSQKVDHIDFMKVDVEGLEYDVLIGNDWSKYRPEVICIEANHIIKDWRPILKTQDYGLEFFDGLNEYYVDLRTSRRSKFDYVENVILNHKSGLRSEDFDLITQLRSDNERSQAALRDTHIRLQAALAESSKQNKQYQQLSAENHLNHLRSAVAERALRNPSAFVKYQLKRLHHLLLRSLSPRNKQPDYTDAEKTAVIKWLKRLSNSDTDKQRLASTKELASVEVNRLKRVYRASRQPLGLRIYLRSVGFIKYLRLRKG